MMFKIFKKKIDLPARYDANLVVFKEALKEVTAELVEVFKKDNPGPSTKATRSFRTTTI